MQNHNQMPITYSDAEVSFNPFPAIARQFYSAQGRSQGTGLQQEDGSFSQSSRRLLIALWVTCTAVGGINKQGNQCF